MSLGDLATSLGKFVVLQGIWMACVAGAGAGNLWIGPLLVAGLVAVHLGLAADRGAATGRLLALTAIGTAADSTWSGLGLIQFVGSPRAWLAPAWIIALWAHFAVLLRTVLEPLRHRPWLAAALGLLGGPLAYRAGAALGSATLADPPWLTYAVLGVTWSMVVPLGARALNPRSSNPTARSEAA